jgi:hypothetical protein
MLVTNIIIYRPLLNYILMQIQNPPAHHIDQTGRAGRHSSGEGEAAPEKEQQQEQRRPGRRKVQREHDEETQVAHSNYFKFSVIYAFFFTAC